MNRLSVYLCDRLVGWLDEQTDSSLRFSYLPEYVQAGGTALSFALPVRENPYAGAETEAYFSNLLPDDYVRTRIGEILQIPRDNTFALLKAIGGDCAGAVAFYPEGVTPQTPAAEFRKLSDREAVRILSDLEKRPLDVGEEGVRISGAGAQDKLVACVRGRHVYLPLNGTPSTHIVKPDIRNYPNSVLNEWYSMQLAKACGLTAAKCGILRLQGSLYYVTERYDRETDGGEVRRLHQEDFCQILGVDPKRKYESVGGPGLVDCFALLRRLELSAKDTVEMLNRVFFNFLIGNGDAHGKNFSILYRDGKSFLAPLYDIMCTTVYRDVSKRMAMKIDGEYGFRWMTRGKFIRMGVRLGFGERLVVRTLDRMAARISAAAPRLAEKCRARHPSRIYDEIVEGIARRCAQVSETGKDCTGRRKPC